MGRWGWRSLVIKSGWCFIDFRLSDKGRRKCFQDGKQECWGGQENERKELNGRPNGGESEIKIEANSDSVYRITVASQMA